jgi:peroxiredoxin
MLKVGDPAPDCTLKKADGSEVKLADFASRTLVVIFLRHLA